MRKATKRRHYALTNPIQLAIDGACKTSEQDLDKLRLLELSAIEAFAQGKATVYDFRSVADLLNLAETMAKTGIGSEALEACQAAQAALLRAKEGYADDVMRLAGADLDALRELFAWHDAQRTAISRSGYERAIQKTMDRIRSAHPDVKVLT